MQKKFLSGLFLILLLNVLIKPFYVIGVEAEVQNQLGTEVYGIYFSLLNFTYLFNILLDLGTTNFNTRHIARHPVLMQKNLSKMLGIRWVLLFLYAAVTLPLAMLIGFDTALLPLLILLVVNQFFVGLIQFARSNFAGLHWFKTDSIFSILDRSLLIVFCLVLLFSPLFADRFDIYWFVGAQTLAYGIAALVALILLLGKLKGISIQVKRLFSYVILRQSFPYALLILLMMTYNRVDGVMLTLLLDDDGFQSGIYAQGYRFLDAVNMFALLFAGLLLPIFSRLIKEGKAIQPMIYLSANILVPIAILLGVSCFFYNETLISARYIREIEASAASFAILIFSFIPVASTYIFGTFLTASGDLKKMNLIAFIGMVVNIVMNLFLIPDYGASGAALATLTTQSFTAIAQFILVYRHTSFSLSQTLFKWMAFFGILFISGYFWWNEQNIPGFQSFLAFAFTALVLMFAFKFFKVSDLKMMVGRKD